MTTPARYRALQWFLDHEELGRTAMLKRDPPTTKMRRLMAREGQVLRIPVGQLDHYQWRLTPAGRRALQNKPQRKRNRTRPDAKQQSDQRSP
jgi:hypothetical protein